MVKDLSEAVLNVGRTVISLARGSARQEIFADAENVHSVENVGLLSKL